MKARSISTSFVIYIAIAAVLVVSCGKNGKHEASLEELEKTQTLIKDKLLIQEKRLSKLSDEIKKIDNLSKKIIENQEKLFARIRNLEKMDDNDDKKKPIMGEMSVAPFCGNCKKVVVPGEITCPFCGMKIDWVNFKVGNSPEYALRKLIWAGLIWDEKEVINCLAEGEKEFKSEILFGKNKEQALAFRKDFISATVTVKESGKNKAVLTFTELDRSEEIIAVREDGIWKISLRQSLSHKTKSKKYDVRLSNEDDAKNAGANIWFLNRQYKMKNLEYAESLDNLLNESYIKLESGVWHGYCFEYYKTSKNSFELYVNPINPQNGRRSFYFDETKVVRTEENGRANKDSDSLEAKHK